MLCSNIKNFLYNNRYTICLILSLFLYAGDAFAMFEALEGAGKSIARGLRTIVYPAATIGVACVCIGGMFGSFNWKWLIAIMLGVFIITYAEQVGFLATDTAVDIDGQG